MRAIDDFRNIDVAEELAAVENTEIVSPSSHLARIMNERTLQAEGICLPWAKINQLFLMRMRQVTLFGGYSGHFKSSLSSQIALGAMQQGYKVGIASLELPFEDLMEQFFSIAAGRDQPPEPFCASFLKWASDKLFVYDRIDSITPDEAVQMIVAFAKYRGCKLVVLDALMMMGVCQDTEREQQFVQTVSAVAKRFDIHVLMVHHMRKPEGRDGESKVPGKFDFIGSVHITNNAHNVLIAWHDKKKAAIRNAGLDVDDSDPDLRFIVSKQRKGKYEGAIGLYQHDHCIGFCNSYARKLKTFSVVTGDFS